MTALPTSRVVHLELHTGDLRSAGAFYSRLLHWSTERIEVASVTYLALDVGDDLGGGIVECDTPCAVWLPYVEVNQIDRVTERARQMGASVLLEPREGPAGWRSVIATPEAGEIALWQPKSWR